MTRRAVLSAALLLVTAGCSREPSPEPLPSLGKVPAFSFVSEQGTPVTETSWKGNVWIADFVFLRCGGTCPQMTAKMAALAEQLASEKRIRFVSFDVDPDHDSVADLAAHARSLGADPTRWSFVRGEREPLRTRVRRGFKLGLEEGKPGDPEPILHSTRFVLVDVTGTIRGYYDALDPDSFRKVAADALRLLREG